MEGTHWANGLHQMIEIKEGLDITQETTTTNLLSNMGYLARYGGNLFGVTGTLGNKGTKDILMKVYQAYDSASQSDRGVSLNYIYDPLTDV